VRVPELTFRLESVVHLSVGTFSDIRSHEPEIGDLEATPLIATVPRVELCAPMERPPIASRHTLGGPSLQVEGTHGEERKVVTVLFADLSGSTALAERLDPEVMRGILASFFNALAHEIQRFGGTIDKYAGDAVMAVFGAPVAHEDDPARALRAALAIRGSVSRLNETVEREHAIRLALRIGLNSGAVVAGTLPGEVQTAYTVVGDAVNTAQRLQSIAEPGAILVGATTQRLTARAFAFDAIEPVRVKGKAEPLAAFRLIGARATATTPVRSALVGRDAELAKIVAAVDAVERGEGRVALVTGEAGIGKSRLLAEARHASAGGRVTALEGRALSITQGISYVPFIEIIRQDAGIAEDDTEDTSWEKFERRLRALFNDETADVLPYLATLVGLSVTSELAERVRYLDAQAMGRQIFASARRYVARLAQERPLVLIFEDWHWADESSAALLEHLLPLVETERLGICVASRPEERATTLARLRDVVARDHGLRFVEVRLARLPPPESERLLANLVPIDAIPATVRALILERTDGNPLFVEEVVRSLVDLGGIVRGDGGEWRATERLERITIPDTVHGVIVARIDRLNDEVKEVLKLASVIGRSFLERLLRAIAEADDALGGALAELQQLELIRERSRIPELEYVFKHALVHDAAYESLLLQRRKELHARVGEAIERLFAERIEEFYGVLAYHFARAENWEKAQDYLFKAGDRAERVAGDAEALGHYRQAVAAYGRAFGDRWEPAHRASVERRIGEALFRRGELAPAREHLERCLDLLGFPVPSYRRGARLGILRELLRQVGHRAAPRFFLQKRSGRAIEETLRAAEVLAFIDYGSDPERLALGALRTLNVSESSDYAPGIVLGSTGIGLMCDAFGLVKVASDYHQRAVAVAESIAQPLWIGNAYFGLAIHEAHAIGDGAAAETHYRMSYEAYRQTGDVKRACGTIAVWCYRLRFRSDFEAVLTRGREIMQAGSDAADEQLKLWGSVLVGVALVDLGDLAGAEPHIRSAIRIANAISDHRSLVTSSALLGLWHLRRGEIYDAISKLEMADRISRERRIRQFHVTMTLTTLVEAYLAAAERGDRERWLRKARDASKASIAHGKVDRQAFPGAYRWRGSYEWLRGDPAAARKWWDRSSSVATTLGGLRDLEVTRQERARLEKVAAPSS